MPGTTGAERMIMETLQPNNIHWSENVILADADYLGQVAFDLTVYFERALNRRLPAADFSTWAVDVALDGGLRAGDHETQVVLVHDKDTAELRCFTPARLDSELNAQAFRDDKLGEFIISSFPVESVTTKGQYLEDILTTLLAQDDVHRIMVVADTEGGDSMDHVRRALRDYDDDVKHVTVLGMQQQPGGRFRQELLGYSVINALGIKADELK